MARTAAEQKYLDGIKAYLRRPAARIVGEEQHAEDALLAATKPYIAEVARDTMGKPPVAS